RSLLPYGLVQTVRTVFAYIHLVAAAVNNAPKLIFNKHRIIQRKLTRLSLLKELYHHRRFHGAGGMKHLFSINEKCSTAAIQAFKGHSKGDRKSTRLNSSHVST